MIMFQRSDHKQLPKIDAALLFTGKLLSKINDLTLSPE